MQTDDHLKRKGFRMLYFLYIHSIIAWEVVFTEKEVDVLFNCFLNTYLRIFYHSFLLKKTHHNHNHKAWITTGIKISSQHKRDLYLICGSTKDPKLKSYYKTYCRILSEVIKMAKILHYNKLIINSNNKLKTIWNTVKMGGKDNDNIPPLNIDGKTTKDSQKQLIFLIPTLELQLVKYLQIIQ
jgi:hypothetical protein